MHIDKQILFKRIKILFVCRVLSFFYLLLFEMLSECPNDYFVITLRRVVMHFQPGRWFLQCWSVWIMTAFF